METTLEPETEALLRVVAARRGLTPEQTVDTLLMEQEQVLAELRASEEDHEAGRSMTIDEYRASAMARRQARDGVKDNQ